ncbi:unnamed protein product [Euphydryas editha]|uniref:MADF domain-containing protein n=1 Tax=Euphydryas editha TaxID=104508 RepID=A0AAU9TVD8_EUPED|nr:unnamed protein product [Euphydryas editha]
MEDENSIQSENSVDTVEGSTATDEQYLSVFIKTWETYPELWNTSCKAYRDIIKKNNALDKLLDIYKQIKPNSTRQDVTKKINPLRTKFRKELKKIHKSKLSGKGNISNLQNFYQSLKSVK